jgi:hypothetical protein
MMTDGERIARLEARLDTAERWLESIDHKVDQLIAVANRGRGGLATILWLGGTLAGVAAMAAALASIFHLRPPT